MAHGQSSDPNVFILPDLGEGVHEAELIKWRVKPGQAVAEHDILAEMETDKALVEVPSPRAGVVQELHGSEGEILKVGNPLVTYAGGKASARVEAKPEPRQEHRQEPRHDPKPHAKPEPGPEHEEREDAGTVVGSMSNDLGGVSASPGKALATPAVRRLARDLGVDIDRLHGSGIGGRVLEKDVRDAGAGSRATPRGSARPEVGRAEVARPAPRPEVKSEPRPEVTRGEAPRRGEGGEEVTRIPFRGVRRTIANRLRESVDRAVHFTVMDEADVSTLDTLRRKLAGASGEKVSFLPFVVSAVCRVLGEQAFRSLNATVDESGEGDGFILQHRGIHVGIATDTDNGLMVPVIRDADRLGVLEISRSIAMTAEMARSRSIPREQLMGSTFTISNVGSHAGRFATPIINYPEVGILAVGRARESVVVQKGAFRVGMLLPLSLACDHRVVDAATAALALARVVELLQSPEGLMAPAR